MKGGPKMETIIENGNKTEYEDYEVWNALKED